MKRLLKQAVEMLEETKPYDIPLERLGYSFREARGRSEVSFLRLLEDAMTKNRWRERTEGAEQRNKEICLNAIAEAMDGYFIHFRPQSYAFMQETKSRWEKWLKEIAERNGIAPPKTPEHLKTDPHEMDTAVTMLKELHGRQGITVVEMADKMGLTERAVQKNLIKLDPDLSCESEEKKPTVPFHIGGRPVTVQIDKRPPKTKNKYRYRTINTVHPIVLLENQMQIGMLLKALAHSYYSENSGTCYSIGLDIWYQLSDYAKERVKVYFEPGDAELQDFIFALETAVPDGSEGRFLTEREMVNSMGQTSFSERELLNLASKGSGRRCNLLLANHEEELVGYSISEPKRNGEEVLFLAKGPKGEQIEFCYEDLEEISFPRYCEH